MLNIDPLITHTMALEDINKAFDLMRAGESIRRVVKLRGGPSRTGHGAQLHVRDDSAPMSFVDVRGPEGRGVQHNYRPEAIA